VKKQEESGGHFGRYRNKKAMQCHLNVRKIKGTWMKQETVLGERQQKTLIRSKKKAGGSPQRYIETKRGVE